MLHSIVGFTTMSKAVKPDQVMAYLNELFTAFDELVDTYQIYKVRLLLLDDQDRLACLVLAAPCPCD